MGDFSVYNFALIVMCLLVAMTIHEYMHAYVGFKLGDTTARDAGRLSLNPMHHIDPVMTVLLPAVTWVLWQFIFLAAKPVPFHPGRVKFNEYGAALIAAAGPLSNLALAVVAAFVLKSADLSGFLLDAMSMFLVLNVALFVFNLIPIPPLDGSRVVYALAPEPVQDFMERIEPYGFMIIVALILLGGFGSWLGNLNQQVLNIIL
ncbi:zinc metalloprotease ywhC [Candidatus Saccharibacteria bacterium]|nr:MAG: zinc metalloprotease ywhC [Candidatus Saccharibacteria bacterium]PID98866.1 MAG: zinc metalloprotease ywhC [Candidatus Saccharibacteria bacterium]